MAALVLSVAALVIGPLLVRALGNRRGPLAVLDGFVLTAIVGLIALHVLPQSLLLGGGVAAVAALVGLLLPAWLEHGEAHDLTLHKRMLLAAMVGLAVHGMLDGAALASDEHGHEHGVGLLAVGVLLHRVPFGLALWWSLAPTAGRRTAIAVLALYGVATIVGFAGAHAVVPMLPLSVLGTFQALVAGTLLHVLGGQTPAPLQAVVEGRERYSALGALGAVAVLATMADSHPVARRSSEELGAGATFATLARSLAPALLVGVVLCALAPVLAGMLRRARSAGGHQLWRAVALGMVHPEASASESPAVSAPLARVVAFSLSASLAGIEALLVTVALLGWRMATARALAAVVVSALAGLAVALVTPPGDLDTRAPDPTSGWRDGLERAADRLLPWMVFGLAIAALVEPLVVEMRLAMVPAPLAIALVALAGAVVYLPAAAATPVAAILVHKGLGAGAALALLLATPVTRRLRRWVLPGAATRRPTVVMWATIAATAAAAGLMFDRSGLATAPELHPRASEGPSLIETVALVALVGLLLASLWRRGPRALLGELFGAAHHHHDHHDHEHHPAPANAR
jgi:hypothetical protein